VEWFGGKRPVTALVDNGRFAMIGLHLLEDYVLTIDYPARTVTVQLPATP
jgi:hypothetical protein